MILNSIFKDYYSNTILISCSGFWRGCWESRSSVVFMVKEYDYRGKKRHGFIPVPLYGVYNLRLLKLLSYGFVHFTVQTIWIDTMLSLRSSVVSVL